MRITVVGRGKLGGGLADLWERAGHEVTRLGRGGGDVSDADAVLVAVPGGAIAEAFECLRGVEGKTMIDATNLPGVPPPTGFASNAEFVKSKTHGPTAKSFNFNFASLFGRLGEARARPGNLRCGDEEARDPLMWATERRARAAGELDRRGTARRAGSWRPRRSTATRSSPTARCSRTTKETGDEDHGRW